MSSSDNAFHVPTVEEMADDEEYELPSSSRFKRGAIMAAITSPAKSSSSQPSTSSSRSDSGSAVNSRAAATSGPSSAFSSCFTKLTETTRHQEIQQDLLSMKPEVSDKERTTRAAPSVGAKTHSILVNAKQKGNPLLQSISQVPWEYESIVPDYVMGRNTCCLFLSLRYHNLNPDYIHDRLKELGRMYELRVLLVLVDLKDPHHTLKGITKIAILADCTLILAWSNEEAGKYIETYKIMENKPPDILMKRQEPDNAQKIADALTSVKSVNKRDATVLLSMFKTLENIINAKTSTLSSCPGVGQLKAEKLHKVLHERFLKNEKKS